MTTIKPDLKTIDFLFSKISEGVAYCKILTDSKGNPIDWIYLDVNEAYEQINGVHKADIVGKKATEVLPNIRNDPGNWISIYGQVALTGEPIVTERYADVRKKWYHVSAYSPQKGYFISIFEDISERKKSEEVLRLSEAKYRSLFINMMDGFAHCQMLFDNNGKPIDFIYLDVNDAFERLTGLRADVVLGKKVSEAIPGTLEANPELIEIYGRVALNCTSERFEIYFKPLSKWFFVSVYCERKGYFIATFQNITERKQAEAALHKSEQRWVTTLSSIGDAVIATDTEEKITFMNPVAEELTGWTLAEVKQKPVKQVFNIINEHTRKGVESPVTKVLKQGLVVGLANHTVLIRKDGSEVPIDDSGAPIITEGGVICGVVLVFRDITERKKIEDALQRQATLIDLSPNAIIVRRLDGTITFWNKGAEKIYGWTKQEALGKSTHKLFQTKFPESFDTITSKLKAEKYWSGELVHKTKSGQEITVQSWWLAEKTDHGEIDSILESNVDLTERIKAEVEIAQAKQRLEAHMNNSPEAVIEFDSDFRVIRWSEQATRVFGWSKEEILGKCIAELPWVYQDDVKIVQQVSADMFSGKKPQNVSYNRNLRKDGSVIDCEWYNSAIYDQKGNLVSILSQVLDITERKSAEKEIARLASFPTLNPSPVLEVSSDDKITYTNPATKRLFPDLEKAGLSHVFFGNWETIKATFKDQKTNSHGREIKIDNHWYHQEFYLVPMTHQIRIYTTDINELKQTEEARAAAQQKIEKYASQMEKLAEQRAQQLKNTERLAAIGQTAGMVGHDIRNPLQAITGDMYLISEEVNAMQDGESKKAIAESIDSINRNLLYINKIVSDLQDYTRPLQPYLQEANLAELIEGTLLTINIPNGIEVTTIVEPKAKLIKTDLAYMRRMLQNLITNAVQAMQEEGKLTIQACMKKGMVVLCVEDTGVGIPEEVKGKMFTPLFTTKSKGQGLGLAVVRRLVDALNGQISFESTAGKGTKFTVELPQNL